MTNEHSGHRARLRDRVRKEGLKNFQDYQVLEYVLTFAIPYKDTNVIAHRLINRFGSFYGVLEADEEDLASVEGMGEVSAHLLSNFLNIYHYYELDRSKRVETIVSPGEAYRYVKQFLIGKLVEEMFIVCLTPKNKIVSVEKIAEGTNSETSVPMRIIIEKMGKAKVSNVIIAHNHPKGKPRPSQNDDKFTKALVTTLSINGCHLLDHIIIGEEGEYYSYRNEGIIDDYVRDAAQLVNFQSIAQPSAEYKYGGASRDKK